jgi:hypothetical protein
LLLDSGRKAFDAFFAAALDYRVEGIFLRISSLGVGWAKLQELAKYITYFRASGKWSVAYFDRGGEKEYFLASCCAEVFVPPSGNLFLRGLAVSGAPYAWQLLVSWLCSTHPCCISCTISYCSVQNVPPSAPSVPLGHYLHHQLLLFSECTTICTIRTAQPPPSAPSVPLVDHLHHLDRSVECITICTIPTARP